MKALVELVNRRPTVVAWTIGLVIVGTLAYYLISALHMPDSPADLGQPQITMSKVQGQGEHGTQLGWRFVADSSQTSTDGMLTTYRHIHDGTYYLKGKPAYKITADQVVVDLRPHWADPLLAAIYDRGRESEIGIHCPITSHCRSDASNCKA